MCPAYEIFEPRIDTIPQLCRCIYAPIDPTVQLIHAIVDLPGLSRCRRCLRIRHADPTAVQPANEIEPCGIDTVLQVTPPDCEEPVSPQSANSVSEAECTTDREPIQLNADVTDAGWSRQRLREWLLERIQHPPYPSAKHIPHRSKTIHKYNPLESDITLRDVLAFAKRYVS
jgi:hypothetical protein